MATVANHATTSSFYMATVSFYYIATILFYLATTSFQMATTVLCLTSLLLHVTWPLLIITQLAMKITSTLICFALLAFHMDVAGIKVEALPLFQLNEISLLTLQLSVSLYGTCTYISDYDRESGQLPLTFERFI